MMETRRSWLRRLIHAAILVVVGYGIEKGLEEVLPDELPTIHGTGNVTLGPLTAGPYTLAAETGSFTLAGGAASLRVSGA
jgi:hypothetical protein